MKPTARCPTCKRDSTKDGNKFFPFCCERCQLVDLGKWLDEEYRIPAEPVDGGSEPEAEVDRSRVGVHADARHLTAEGPLAGPGKDDEH